MMGYKARAFAPLVPVSLEELVPRAHFYRLLHHALDLAFVRDLVAPFYAKGGRPSVDPIVFFRLHTWSGYGRTKAPPPTRRRWANGRWGWPRPWGKPSSGTA